MARSGPYNGAHKGKADSEPPRMRRVRNDRQREWRCVDGTLRRNSGVEPPHSKWADSEVGPYNDPERVAILSGTGRGGVAVATEAGEGAGVHLRAGTRVSARSDAAAGRVHSMVDRKESGARDNCDFARWDSGCETEG